LVRANAVGATRDGDGQTKAGVVGEHHEVGASLAGGVWAARLDAIRLDGSTFQDLPVHLVCTDLVEAFQLQLFGGLQQHKRPVDVGHHKAAGIGE